MSGGLLLQMVLTFNCCEHSITKCSRCPIFIGSLRSPFVSGSEEGRTGAYDATLPPHDVTGKRNCYNFVTSEIRKFLRTNWINVYFSMGWY